MDVLPSMTVNMTSNGSEMALELRTNADDGLDIDDEEDDDFFAEKLLKKIKQMNYGKIYQLYLLQIIF